MTKKFILVISLLFVFQANANYKGLFCNTGETNGSTYALKKNESGFSFMANHLGGLGVIPVSTSGDITLGQLEWVKMKAKLFKKLGTIYSVNFNHTDCKFNKDLKIGVCKKEQLAISNIHFEEFAVYYTLGKYLHNGRVSNSNISLTYKIKDNSPDFNGDQGSEYMTRLLALDLEFQKGCVFRDF